MKKNQAGFTLIELVIVIVILGILAVTAMPKYLSFTDEARASTTKALGGAINSAKDIVYAKSVIANQEKKPTGLVEGVSVNYGYPSQLSSGIISSIDADIKSFGASGKNSDSEWVYQLVSISSRLGVDIALGSVVGDSPNAKIPQSTGCYVRYYVATEKKPAEVVKTVSGC